MSIVLSSSPANNSGGTGLAAFQEWAPVSGQTNLFFADDGGLLIPPMITFKIKDVIGLDSTVQYSSFRLKGYQVFSPATPAWVGFSSYSFANHGYPNDVNSPIPIDANGMSFTFMPLITIPIAHGVYTFTHHFIIEGLRNGSWEEISTYQHVLSLTYTATSLVTFSPPALSYDFYQNSTLPYQEVTMNGPSWKLSFLTQYFTIVTGATITTTTIGSGANATTTISGTGNAVIQFYLSSYFNDNITFDPQDLNNQITVSQGSGTVIGTIPYSIVVHQVGALTSGPTEMHFAAVKDLVESAAQTLYFNSPSPCTFSYDPWLICDQVIIQNGAFVTSALNVHPIPTANMAAGDYVGYITITTVIDGVTSSRTTTVYYTISDFVVDPFGAGRVNFTLDQLAIPFSSTLLQTHFDVRCKIAVAAFFTDFITVYNYDLKIVPCKGHASLYLGPMIHRLLDRFGDTTGGTHQYIPATLDVDVSEVNDADNSVVRSASLPPSFWVAGLSFGELNFAILDINKGYSSATTGTTYFLNALVPAGGYLVRVVRNGNVVSSFSATAATAKVVSHKITFDSFTPGDVIDLSIAKKAEERTKRFVMLPAGNQSNLVIWEDDYLVRSTMECTGSYQIKTDYERQAQTLYQALVSTMEILDASSDLKFTINTGWKIQDDTVTVDSLMRSKRVWIFGSSKALVVRPIGKSITNYDTERELIEYALEFQINKSYNEETCSSRL